MKNFFCVFSILCFLFIGGCSEESSQPSEEKIENALAMKLEPGVSISELNIEVSKKVENANIPEVVSRSTFELTFNENFYEQIDSVKETPVVKLVASKGETLQGTIVTRSVIFGEKGWNTAVESIEVAQILGKAESQYGKNGFFIDQSSEHRELVAKIKEEERLVEEARRAKMLELREALTGKWSTDEPMLSNGNVWSGSSERNMAFEVTIPKGTEVSGEASVTMYDYDSPWLQVEIPAKFRIAKGGSEMKINLSRKTEFERVGFTLSHHTDITFTRNGKLRFPDDWKDIEYSNQLKKAENKVRLAKIKRYEAIMKEHNPLIVKANSAMSDLPLEYNTYAMFLVEGNNHGRVIGVDQYHPNSWVQTATVHAGLLKAGETGVIKITLRKLSDCVQLAGKALNGVVSRAVRSCYGTYRMELVEKI
ncbi:hypothetical protein VBY75_11315 [Idiomarina sp. HB]|uniref:hypothetical protein n=1 Tax=Idiomarina sp. HB TaxID=3110479 RepID=UPI003A7F9FD5